MDWIFVGLGNPGTKYKLNRHNIGFLVLDALKDNLAPSEKMQKQDKALIAKLKWHDQKILLVQPQTFMNLSGESVVPLMQFYKVPLDKLVVIHDELDIPFQSLRFQKNRGPGGHNGVKSISTLLGTADYIRLKIGVGRPPHPQMNVADYVLQNFSSEEMIDLPKIITRSMEALESLMLDGLNKASTLFNK